MRDAREIDEMTDKALSILSERITFEHKMISMAIHNI